MRAGASRAGACVSRAASPAPPANTCRGCAPELVDLSSLAHHPRQAVSQALEGARRLERRLRKRCVRMIRALGALGWQSGNAPSHYSNITVTLPSHYHYITVTLPSHCRHMTVT